MYSIIILFDFNKAVTEILVDVFFFFSNYSCRFSTIKRPLNESMETVR